jgi:hypothetical protein
VFALIKNRMSKFKIVLVSMTSCLILTAQSRAQITNQYPATILETLESATGQVVVKGTAPIGSISIGSTDVSLVCKEDKLVSTGNKQYGVMIGIKPSGQAEDRTLIDYDEMDSLMASVDYLLRVDWSVTSLASFDASHTTKAGLRLKAFSSKRTSKIEFALNGSHLTRILLSPDQVSQFYALLAQGKAKLDALRNGQ